MKEAKLTEIVVIMDRSGSMAPIKDDMEGGLWSMIQEQHGLPGKCRISLYRFDHDFEVSFEGKDSGEIKREDCMLSPRGSTALNDAIVKSLSSAEERIVKEPEEERPELVVAVVITDGLENASRENSADDARNIIKRMSDKYNWQFAYLAADEKGFAEGQRLVSGIAQASVGSYARGQSGEAHRRYSAQIKHLRSNTSGSIDVSGRKK